MLVHNISSPSCPDIETGSRAEIQSGSDKPKVISNKFPNDPPDPSGKVFGVADASPSGRVVLPGNRQIPREVDFVITPDKKLILGRKHATLADNGGVLAAGQLSIKNGKIRRIDNKSGHYRPTVEDALEAPELLRELGYDLEGTALEAFRFEINSENLITSSTREIIQFL